MRKISKRNHFGKLNLIQQNYLLNYFQELEEYEKCEIIKLTGLN